MKRWLFLGFRLALLALALFVADALLDPSGDIREKYQRLGRVQTLAQAEAILGKRADEGWVVEDGLNWRTWHWRKGGI